MKKYKIFRPTAYVLLVAFYAAIHNFCFSIGVNIPKNLMRQILETILGILPNMLDSGITPIGRLAEDLWNHLPAVISAAAHILAQLQATIANAASLMRDKTGQVQIVFIVSPSGSFCPVNDRSHLRGPAGKCLV